MEEFQQILAILFLVFMLYTLYLIFNSRIILKKIEAKRYINKLEKETDFFNEERLYEIVNETFFTLQKAAVEQRLDIAKEYMTEECYESWSMPLQWALLQNGYVQPHETTLRYCWIVAIEANLEKKDHFWVYIEGYHDKQPFIFNDVSTKEQSLKEKGYWSSIESNAFRECWHFVRKDDHFYLDQMIPYRQMKIRTLKSNISL